MSIDSTRARREAQLRRAMELHRLGLLSKARAHHETALPSEHMYIGAAGEDESSAAERTAAERTAAERSGGAPAQAQARAYITGLAADTRR